MTFLLSEDKALRTKLQGIVVTDQKADDEETPRPVGVWFGQPDQEIRTQSYPYITIDLIDVIRDPEREMRGTTDAAYLQGNLDLNEAEAFEIELPIPVNLDYQITTYSRHPRHDRAIMGQLLGVKLPIRFGILEIDDHTVRRLDVLDISKRDVTEQSKRLFINAITVRVSSEISQVNYKILNKVLEVHIDDPSAERAGGRLSNPYFLGLGAQVLSE
jgi:hypothetical protein